jgi:hypothetical protein
MPKQKPLLSPSYAASLADMDKRFAREHKAAIDPLAMQFTAPILKRTPNPHGSMAVTLLEHMVFSVYSDDKWIVPSTKIDFEQERTKAKFNPGFMAFDDQSLAIMRCAKIQTRDMKEKGYLFFVFKDLTVMFARKLPNDHTKGRLLLLPTPLSLIDTVTLLAGAEPIKLSCRGSGRDIGILDVMVGQSAITQDGRLPRRFTTTDDDPDVSTDDEAGTAFLRQLEVEGDALSARLDGLNGYDLVGLPEHIGPGTEFHRVTTLLSDPSITRDRMAFLGRPEVRDDDAHLGFLKADIESDALKDISRMFELAVEIAAEEMRSDISFGPRPAHAIWVMPNPRTPNATVTIDNIDRVTGKQLSSRIAATLGTDTLRVSRRLTGFSNAGLVKGASSSDIAIKDVSFKASQRSSHERLMLYAEAQILRDRISTYITDKDLPEKRVKAIAVHR